MRPTTSTGPALQHMVILMDKGHLISRVAALEGFDFGGLALAYSYTGIFTPMSVRARTIRTQALRRGLTRRKRRAFPSFCSFSFFCPLCLFRLAFWIFLVNLSIFCYVPLRSYPLRFGMRLVEMMPRFLEDCCKPPMVPEADARTAFAGMSYTDMWEDAKVKESVFYIRASKSLRIPDGWRSLLPTVL